MVGYGKERIEGKIVDVLAIIVISMVLMPLFVSMLANLLGQLFKVPTFSNKDAITLVAMLAQELALFWLTAGVLLSNGYNLASIGLSWQFWVNHSLLGVVSGLGLLLVNSIGDLFSVWFFGLFFSSAQVEALLQKESSVLTQLLNPNQPPWQVLLLLGLVGVVAPIVEETFFRGYAYSIFRNRLGVFKGAAASAFLFALVHLYVVHFFPIFLLGLVLCLLYEKTNSLLPPIVAHSVMNLLVAWLIYGQAAA